MTETQLLLNRMTDVNPRTVLVLSLALDTTISTETVRECFDLVNRETAENSASCRPPMPIHSSSRCCDRVDAVMTASGAFEGSSGMSGSIVL
jgi:hypothetical protein